MTLDDLAAYGANVQEGLGRCMNMEAFYLQLVETIKAEPNFDALAAAIDARVLGLARAEGRALQPVPDAAAEAHGGAVRAAARSH